MNLGGSQERSPTADGRAGKKIELFLMTFTRKPRPKSGPYMRRVCSKADHEAQRLSFYYGRATLDYWRGWRDLGTRGVWLRRLVYLVRYDSV